MSGNRGKFKTAMVDVPHQFSNARTGGSLKSGASQKYPVMSLDEVKALPITSIMADDSLLLYWTPTALKKESLDVIQAWGYKYVTTLYWIKMQKNAPEKVKMGMGFNVRSAVEECWICKKGKVPALRIQKPNVIFAPIGKHSAKPDEAYQFFEPAISRLDLEPKADIFARISRDGWVPFGNEIDGLDIRSAMQRYKGY
ncbi:MAG: MT-A70 family methyltransferase [Sphaerochaeta sp.]